VAGGLVVGPGACTSFLRSTENPLYISAGRLVVGLNAPMARYGLSKVLLHIPRKAEPWGRITTGGGALSPQRRSATSQEILIKTLAIKRRLDTTIGNEAASPGV